MEGGDPFETFQPGKQAQDYTSLPFQTIHFFRDFSSWMSQKTRFFLANGKQPGSQISRYQYSPLRNRNRRDFQFLLERQNILSVFEFRNKIENKKCAQNYSYHPVIRFVFRFYKLLSAVLETVLKLATENGQKQFLPLSGIGQFYLRPPWDKSILDITCPKN